jgi:hypothetical protein
MTIKLIDRPPQMAGGDEVRACGEGLEDNDSRPPSVSFSEPLLE